MIDKHGSVRSSLNRVLEGLNSNAPLTPSIFVLTGAQLVVAELEDCVADGTDFVNAVLMLAVLRDKL